MLVVNNNPLGRYQTELDSVVQTGFTSLSDKGKTNLLNNIKSIASKTDSGTTETLYYPASGLDILRPLIAYNTTTLILIDSMNDYHQTVKTVLTNNNIEFQESTNGNQLTLTFYFLDKSRTINVIEGDARRYPPSYFNLETVDVLHVFLPTGADQPLEADGQGYPAITSFLTWDLYKLVTEGGFLIFQEHPLSNDEVTEDLLWQFGLEPVEITRRPPGSITTGIQQNSDDDPSSQEGVIYKKTRCITEAAFEVLDSAIKLSFDFCWHALKISTEQLKCALLSIYEVPDGEEIIKAIGDQLEEYYNELETLKSHLESNGCFAEDASILITRYKDSALQRVAEAQGEIRSWIERYNEAVEDPPKDDEYIKNTFEITKDEYEEVYSSLKYPLIAKLLALRDYGDDNDLQSTKDAVQRFLEHDFTQQFRERATT